ncbi:MAG: TIGR03087 family PEP-CTERM/XrtA system glycosyltransferase [Alphaproteobacteria bacterium]|nr:TIGR03087 family PEP-CTERM/XrtA system glycosyltransferase [Alphaproteobacteria bacterium]
MRDMLFLSQRIPYPPNKGDKIRSFNILKHFSATHRIHLGCFIDDPEDWEHVTTLQDYCVDTCIVPLNKIMAKTRSLRAFFTGAPLNLPYFYDRVLDDWVKTVFTDVKPHAAFAFSSQMGQYFLQAAPRPSRMVIDYCDVDSDKWHQYAQSKSWPASWLFERESRTLLEFDRRVAKAVDAGTFVAAPEVELFESLAPETRGKIHAIGNGIDTEYFSPEKTYPSPYDAGGPIVIFTGAMDYWPNVDAVVWFATDIFPRVRDAIQDARFFIVGGSPSPDVLKLEKIDGVHVAGRVPDMRPYFVHAQAAVTPMRIARGIQNKVLEAMAMSKPTVTTPTALAGIDATRDTEILVAEDADTFAAQTVYALRNPAASDIGDRAKAFVSRSYTWSSQLAPYDALVA